MVNKYDYATTIGLNHNEVPATLNVETGEVIPIKKPRKNTPSNKDTTYERFDDNDQPWQRCFTKAWQLLQTQTTEKEYYVAFKLGLMAKAYTNSLEPISPDCSALEIAEQLKVDRRIVQNIFNKLFSLGVIAKFEVANKDESYKRFYIFNPYLSFNGKVIKKETAELFKGTYYSFM